MLVLYNIFLSSAEFAANKDRRVIKIGDNEVNQVENFECLGLVAQKRGGSEEGMMHEIKQRGCMKWKEASSVMCDRTIDNRIGQMD